MGFKADPKKAEAKFKNRMIPMTGEIASIEIKEDKFKVKTAHVALKTPPDGMTISCEFRTQSERGTADLKAGDKIAFFGGQVMAKGNNLRILSCVLDEKEFIP